MCRALAHVLQITLEMKYEMQLVKLNPPPSPTLPSCKSRGPKHLTGHLCAWLLRDIAHIGLINNIKPVSYSWRGDPELQFDLATHTHTHSKTDCSSICRVTRNRCPIAYTLSIGVRQRDGQGVGQRQAYKWATADLDLILASAPAFCALTFSLNWFLFVLAHWQAFKSFNIPIITSQVVNINLQWTQSKLKWFLAHFTRTFAYPVSVAMGLDRSECNQSLSIWFAVKRFRYK